MSTLRWALVFAVLFTLWGIFLQPVDDSDESRFKRSGLHIHRDALTGCEYLAGLFGGPTPRLNAEGRQICRDKP